MREQAAAIQKKQQTMRLKRILGIILACIIFFGVLWASGFLVSGRDKERNREAAFKYYTSVHVKKGDTLWSIARSYISPEYKDIMVYIEEVKALNQLEHDEIHSGQYLMVPYYSNEFR